MAIITQAAAIVVANTIRDEVIVNANTCLRVGGLLRDMADSMWPGDHADTHLPGGTDALATGAPVSIGSINAEGNAVSLSRSDHVHAHDEQGGGNQHTVATTVLAGFMSVAQVVDLGAATSHVAITNGNPHGVSIANIGSGTLAQLNTAISDFDIYSTAQVDAIVGGYVPTSRTLTAGNGLIGGGDLSQNRSFAVGALDGTIVSASGGVRVGTLLSANFADHTIAPARITNGTNGQVLTMVSGDPAWASRSSSDYAQFLLLDGSRSMTGALNMGGQQITNVGNVDGVDVSAHAARHLPGGADALAVDTPVSLGDSLGIGSRASFSRSDHVHTHGNRPGGTLHALATTTAHGFMASSQVTALNAATSHVAITNSNPHGTSIANLGSGTLAQLNTAISDFNLYSTVQVDTLLTGYVPTSRTLTAGNGLTGGGTLAADRTFAVGATNSTITVAADGIAVGTIGDGQITNDTISAAKLYHGAANSVVWSNGTASSWSTTPTLVGLTLTSATNTTLQITSGTSGIAALSLGDTDSSTRGGVSYANATDAMLLRAGGAPIVRVTNADFSPYSAESATLGGAFRWGASHFGAVTVTGGVDFNNSAAVDVTTINATAYIPRTTEVTLNSSGVATVTGTCHTVDTYADAASDTMTTITDPGFPVGTILTLRCENNARDVIVSTGGNINLPYGLSTFLMGHVSTPILFVKCLSGAWSMLPPPLVDSEQGALSVGSVYSSIVDISNRVQFDSVASDPAAAVGFHRLFSRGEALCAQNQNGSHYQLSPADTSGTSYPSIRLVRTRSLRSYSGASAQYITLSELADQLADGQCLTLQAVFTVTYRGALGSQTGVYGCGLYVSRSGTSYTVSPLPSGTNPQELCSTRPGLSLFTCNSAYSATTPTLRWYSPALTGYDLGMELVVTGQKVSSSL